MNKDKPHLKSYERHAACALSGLLVGLGLLAVVEMDRFQPEEMMSVQVVGAVRSAQIILPSGSTLDDLFARAVLVEGADLSELDGSRRLMNGDIIVVPYKNATTLYVTGAVVEPKVVVLEKDARPIQVLEYIQPQHDADLTTLRRRKKVRNGSILDIKKKKESRQRCSYSRASHCKNNNDVSSQKEGSRSQGVVKNTRHSNRRRANDQHGL